MMRIDPSKLNLSEKDIEDYLWLNPTIVTGSTDEYGISRWLARQLAVPSGILDLFGINNNGDPVVVEIKNGPIDARALAQVSRYAEDIRRVFFSRRGWFPHNAINVQKYAVGTSCDAQSVHEAYAIGVKIVVFSFSLNVNFAPVEWTKDHMDKMDAQYRALARREDVFSAFNHLCGDATYIPPEVLARQAEESRIEYEKFLAAESLETELEQIIADLSEGNDQEVEP